MTAARLGVAGVGLIGGSIALRARALGMHVVGFDRDAQALSRAADRGAIDSIAPDLASLAALSATLVVALPVDATSHALQALAGTPGPSLVMDVASVKAALVGAGRAVPNYVGTHPMAGREQGGIDAADAALFERATWAHSPHADPELVARVRAFITAMGAIPLEIAPQRHDAIVALTSHLPQALSVALGSALAAAAAGDPRVMDLCGPGMMSMLRLARSPESTWSPIVAANALPLAEQLRSLAETLTALALSLEAGESIPFMSYFASARGAAAQLEERLGPTPRSSSYSRPQPPANPATPPAR